MTISRKPFGPRRSTAEQAQDAFERSERGERVVSVSRFAALTGFDRGTVKSWIDRGCPTEGRGPKGEVLVDIRLVWKWREDQVRQETLREARKDDADLAGEKMTPADLLKMEQIKATRLKIGRDAEILVLRNVVTWSVERMLGLIRQAVFGLGDGLIRDFPHLDDAERRRMLLKTKQRCADGLAEGSKAVKAFFDSEEFKERLRREIER